MFKSAATKIAHNSTLPALSINKDLKPLQDLINAEKVVLISIQKLSVEFSKSAEALRTWGMGEGEDLGDTLSAASNLLNHFSTALSQYASHEHGIREQMKGIRTREEELDELKRRRKTLIGKADAAEKKLSRMSPEHKNLHAQTTTLNSLQEEIRNMDSQILSDEAALGDMKRSKTRAFLGLKFGGLLECCEKGAIAGEFGRLVAHEIPDVVTEPGMSRPVYLNRPRVEGLLTDAHRCVNEVTFSTVPAPDSQPRERPTPALPPLEDPGALSAPQHLESGHFFDPSDMSGTFSMSMTSGGSNPSSPIHAQQPSYQPSSESYSFRAPAVAPEPAPSQSMDDFGISSPAQVNGGNLPHAGRFATFPVKNTQGQGYALRGDPPTLGERSNPEVDDEDSFSSVVAAALSAQSRTSFDEPAPAYEISRPPGAAAPATMDDPWAGASSHHTRQDSEVGLAYMTNTEEEQIPPAASHTRQASEKQVRFGDVEDVDSELMRRHQQQEEPTMASSSQTEDRTPRRVPPPTLSPEEEARELNAAAAREISREMDSLNFSPPEFNPKREPSPLLPPAAPFTQPSPINESSPSTRYTHHSTASNSSLQNVTTSPISHGAETDRPPRSPVSPKEERRSQSPVLAMPQPTINIPERSVSNLSGATNSPSYRTPPEYPRLGASPLGQRSLSGTGGGPSPGGSPVPPPAGVRTISAAAFRRGTPRMGTGSSTDLGSEGNPGIGSGRGPADTSPLQFKKRLPSSPYPQRDASSAPMPSTLSNYGARDRSGSMQSVGSANANPIPEPHQQSRHTRGEEDEYDYLSAYTDNTPGAGSPTRSDFGSLGQMKVANDPGVTTPPQTSSFGRSGGYSEGRFATDLEKDSLR
ncbi:hypothetical protein K435DRAFT_743288 [Dendrothele bispora CBS 962.96]|uniref:Eisosome component PIL1-domain-containing protein n=1 Tax=Dendrothele bispora (strain CBS 962.96) TaxID=1314807 RepID=A0A4S8MU46_DENBC|nr:hypothetical protein K435DRAFT_743288 [Dendrothele bispora CBS 962.96]